MSLLRVNFFCGTKLWSDRAKNTIDQRDVALLQQKEYVSIPLTYNSKQAVNERQMNYFIWSEYTKFVPEEKFLFHDKAYTYWLLHMAEVPYVDNTLFMAMTPNHNIDDEFLLLEYPSTLILIWEI